MGVGGGWGGGDRCQPAKRRRESLLADNLSPLSDSRGWEDAGQSDWDPRRDALRCLGGSVIGSSLSTLRREMTEAPDNVQSVASATTLF